MSTHKAAQAVEKGKPFEVAARSTPKPGSGELLIEVKSVALNPADTIMQDLGLFIPSYPTVIGFDIAGVVLELGENVPVDASKGAEFRSGMGVAAYSASAWKSCDPKYGAFQERCLVPWQHAAALPEGGLSWNQAATLPVAFQVPLMAWDAMAIPRLREAGQVSDEGRAHKKKALLVWGASSSVGTGGVQSARLLRGDPASAFAAVYATAGAANQDYVRSLGADRVFDYGGASVVEDIVSAAKEDGLVIQHCFLANGQLASCQAVLKAFSQHEGAKIASAPVVPADAEVVPGLETIFIMPAMKDEQERLAQFEYWMSTWLREQLASGSVRPSPEPKVVGKGLEAINDGLKALRQGVSCTKLVVEVSQ